MADILTVDKFSQFIGDQSRVSKDVEDIYLNKPQNIHNFTDNLKQDSSVNSVTTSSRRCA